MELLERDAELRALDDALHDAAGGTGSVVVVGGEAGIGKTRLVTEFVARHGDGTRVLFGACDDLTTPRVLGPVRDIAADLGGELEELLAGSDRTGLHETLLGRLDSGLRSTVVVFEDIHWADAATLDVIKYLGRRIYRTRILLIVTFREDEVAPGDPLHRVLGDLPSSSVTRLRLEPLSAEAVRRLAADRRRATRDLYELTGGNPFLVTELLDYEDTVPGSVLDAIASRLGRLSVAARRAVEQIAVVPGRCDRRVLEALDLDLESALDEGKDRGLIDHDTGQAWFRHGIARRAVQTAIPAADLRRLNRTLVDHLVATGADPGRIVHHAEQAGDVAALLEYGPVAARRARTAAAHREALAHFRRVLPHIHRMSRPEQAELLLEYAVESYTMDDQQDALEAAERSLDLFRELGDRTSEGAALRWLSRIRWWKGDRDRAEEAGARSVEVLEALDPGPDLAMAYSNLSQLHMLAHDLGPAVSWAKKAIATARAVGDAEAESHALNNLGSALVRSGDLASRSLLLESLDIALREKLHEHAVRAYSNFIWVALDSREYELAARYLSEGLAYSLATEHQGSYNYIMAERARLHFDKAEWNEAEEDAVWVLEQPQTPGITTLPALVVLARTKVRRGDEDAAGAVAAAWEAARSTGELQRIGPAAIAAAELAWLRDDRDGARAAIEPAYALALASPQPWVTDEIALWEWRTGGDIGPYDVMAEPYRLQIEGDWEAAETAWDRLGCPYERADALAAAPEVPRRLEALAIFDGLGAAPAAARLRRRLREDGVKRIPRGPRAATRANPAGLTNRQVDVVRLLARGLTNPEIADLLLVSPKTVDHHVSAILAKLEVPSRTDVSQKAAVLGVIET